MEKFTRALRTLPFAHLLGIPGAEAKTGVDKKVEVRKVEVQAKKAEGHKEKEPHNAGESIGKETDKAARQSERARCAAIFACADAASRPDMAAHLAFHTDMTHEEATEMLRAIAAGHVGRTRSLAARMAEVHLPNVGSEIDAPADGPQGAAEKIVAAGNKRRGES
jgi:hypothetical protein